MKTGGHIKPCKVGSVEEHNERDPEYVERMKQSKHPLNFWPSLALRPNQSWTNTGRKEYQDKKTGKAMKVAQVFNQMINVYTEKDSRKRKPPLKERQRFNPKKGKWETVSGWSPIREMVVVIKPDTKIEDFDKVKAWFAKHGVCTMFVSLHFDEGHLDEAGNLVANNHAHMGLDFFDWETGKTVKMGPKKMKELQDILAEALGMERGEIKEITGKEHLDVVEERLDAKLKEEKEVDARLESKRIQESQLDSNIKEKQDLQKRLDESIDNDQTYLQDLRDEVIPAKEKEVDALNDRIETLNRAIEEKKPVLADQKKSIEDNSAIIREQRKELSDIRAEYRNLASSIVSHLQADAEKWKSRFNSAWEGAVIAIEAIINRIIDRRAQYFTQGQAQAVANVMDGVEDTETRQRYGRELMDMAKEDLPESVPDKWVTDTARDVDKIARQDWQNLTVYEGQGIKR